MSDRMKDEKPRTVWQAGVAKSGNFWVHKILETLLDHAGEPRRSYIQNHPIYPKARKWTLSYPEQASTDVIDVTSRGCITRVSSRFNELVEDMDSYLDQTRHVWSHTQFRPILSAPIFERVQPVIYIVRDPRDIMLSMADFVFTDYFQKFFSSPYKNQQEFVEDRVKTFPKHWAYHVRGYMEASARYRVHWCFYERLVADLEGEMDAMADVLGLPRLPLAEKHALAERLSFKSLKSGREGHVNKGKAGRWRTLLTDEQNEMALTLAGDEIARCGYALHKDEPFRTPEPFEVMGV